MSSNLLRTPLYDIHVRHNAKMTEFAGYEMPVVYKSIIEEHRAVREKAGLFDVSHMGEISLEGPDALRLVQRLICGDASRLNVNQAQYSIMCNPNGGIIDDILVYRLGDRKYMLVVNASNRVKDFEWILSSKGSLDAEVKDISLHTALLSLQGPFSRDILKKCFDGDLESMRYYWFLQTDMQGVECIISRTGYTGELGYEIYVSGQDAVKIWDMLTQAGKDYNIEYIGLGARDTLRLEMKYALYGNDIDETTTPLEAGLANRVAFEKNGDFNGKDALLKQRDSGVNRSLIGLGMADKAIPRHDYALLKNGKNIGYVTSGTFSPSLSMSIGMGYVKKEYAGTGSEFSVEIRGKQHGAYVMETPFYKRSKK